MKPALVLAVLLSGLWLSPSSLSAQDTVVTKDGKKTPGRVFQFLDRVELEGKDGKRITFNRKDIERLDLESRIIRCPLVRPFPNDKIKDGDFDFVSAGSTVIAIPKGPEATTGYGVDIPTAATLYELDLTNRVGKPVIANGLAYLMRLDVSESDTIRYKVNGALVKKTVQKLTVTCIDLKTGKPAWTQSFDNLDTAKDLHWEYAPESAMLYLLPKSVVLYTLKRGHAVDKTGVMDAATSKTFASFNAYNIEKQKAEKQTNSDEAINQAVSYVVDDLFIYLWYDGKDIYRVRAFDFKQGRQKWDSEPFRGRLASVAGRRVFLRDDLNLWSLDITSGKKADPWTIEHGNEISSIDEEFVIQFRRAKLPRQVTVWDVSQKKPVEHVVIAMGTDDFSFRTKIGQYLFFTDKVNTFICYDLYARKEAWRHTGPSNGEPRHIYLQGSGVTFYKDGLVTQVDLATGKPVWVWSGDYLRTIQAGDVGTICLKRAGSDVIRERPIPKGARFVTTTATPLRNIYIDDVFGLPAIAGGRIAAVTNKGRAIARDIESLTEAWTLRLAEASNNFPMPAATVGGKFVFAMNGKAHFVDPKDPAKPPAITHSAPDQWTPFLAAGANLVVCDPSGGARAVDGTGKAAWTVKEFNGALHWRTNGKLLWVGEQTRIFEYEADSGKLLQTVPIPQACSMAVVDGASLYVANYGFRVGRIDPDTKGYAWKLDAKNTDAGLVVRFGGRLALAEGVLCWANTDAEIVGLDPATGKQLWKVPLKPWVSPWLIAGGKIHVAAPGVGLLTIDVKTGAMTTINVDDAELFAPVMIADKPCFWSSEGWWIEAP